MDIRFELAKKLLRHAEWEWQDCETGAPAMDPKRPYGNSDVASDVREILDLPDLSDEFALELHRMTLTVLQTWGKKALDVQA